MKTLLTFFKEILPVFLKNFLFATLIVAIVIGTVVGIMALLNFLFTTFGLYTFYGIIPLIFIIIIAVSLTEEELL